MQPESIQRLNTINKTFYQQTAPHFDATRQHPWQGWARLPAYLPADRPLRVLDVGCGNGRFGVWLAGATAGPLAYTGTDANPDLLAAARAALTGILQPLVLRQADFLATPPPPGPFDLIVLFGVVHHIPGHKNRQQILRTLAGRLAPGGVLAFAAWRFYDNPRFRARIVPWETGLDREPGDYLLDWRRGQVARRYCHHVTDAEHDQLVTTTGLHELARYYADGKDNRTNLYSLLKKVVA